MTFSTLASPGVSLQGGGGSGGGGTPGGSDTQIQYNSSGTFAGASGLTTNGTELTIASGTKTADAPVLNMSQTWNNGAVTFTGLKFNATDTASGGSSSLLDLGTGGGTYASKFKVTKAGEVTIPVAGFFGEASGGSFRLSSSGVIVGASGTAILGLANTNIQVPDVILSRRAAANLRLGAADVAAPVAQTLSVQSVVAGTTDTAGTNLTITGSQGTGTGAGGSIIFQVAPAGGSGATQNALATALTISADRNATFSSTSRFGFPSNVNARSYSDGFLFDCGISTDNAIWLGPTGILLRSSLSIGFSSGDAAASADTILRRDDANKLALRNGTNAQLFRVYSTYNGTNDAYGAIGAAVNLDGTAGDANTLYIGSQKKGSPTALTKLAIQVDGTTRLDYNISNANQWFIGGTVVQLNSLWAAADLRAGSGSSIYWNARSQMTSPANGDLKISNLAETDFGRLMFGGITSAFPSLKRVSANLQVIAADGTSSAGLIVGNQALATTATDGFLYVPTCPGTPTGTPTAQTGTVPIVVDTSANKLYFYSDAAWRDAGP